jgi:hypothetical protein
MAFKIHQSGYTDCDILISPFSDDIFSGGIFLPVMDSLFLILLDAAVNEDVVAAFR